jgi:hypothetical protein
VSKNLLNDRRFLSSIDVERGGKQKLKKSSRATEMGTGKKQRDKTRRQPKEH